VAPTAEKTRHVQYVHAVLRANYDFARLVRRTKAKVVHCNDMRALWQTVMAAKLLNVPVVHNIRDIHAPDEPYRMTWHASRILADHTIVLSKSMRDSLVSSVLVPEFLAGPTSVIYSVVDTSVVGSPTKEERSAARVRLGFRDEEPLIGYIATFNRKKDQLSLIQNAGHLLRERGLSVHFLGDFVPERNPYAASCRDAVRERGLENVFHFHGFVEDMRVWYQALDLAILVSRREGLARAMIEPLAHGIPVVAFDVTSTREILEQHACGIVVPRGDYAHLVDAMAQALDPAKRLPLSKAARETAVRLFNPARVVEQYEDIYLRLMRPMHTPKT
jgi:glycosyltransferase involved in cell wall biosynthesis